MGKSYRSEKYAGDGFSRKSNHKTKRRNYSQSSFVSRDKTNKQFELLANMSTEYVQYPESDDSIDNH